MSIAAYQGICPTCRHDHRRDACLSALAPTTRETANHIGEANEKVAHHNGDATTMIDHAELKRLAEAATPGPWDRMAGRGLVRAIRDDLAVPLFEPLEPYSDPLLDAPTCRVGGEVVFRANSQAARESAAIRQAVHNGNFIAAANPATVLALQSEIAALRGEVERVEADRIRTVDDRMTWTRRTLEAERQRDELRKALEPFAEAAESLDDETRDQDHIWEQPAAMSIDAGHLRAARALIANQGAAEQPSDASRVFISRLFDGGASLPSAPNQAKEAGE